MTEVKFRCVVCMENCVAVDYLEFGDKMLLVCPKGHKQFVPKNLYPYSAMSIDVRVWFFVLYAVSEPLELDPHADLHAELMGLDESLNYL